MNDVKKILLRNVPADLHKRILKAAGRRPNRPGRGREGQTSLSKVIIEALEEKYPKE